MDSGPWRDTQTDRQTAVVVVVVVVIKVKR
jgi:hypothetical protein